MKVKIHQYRLLDGGNLDKLVIANIQPVNDNLSYFVYKNNQSNQTVYPSE